MKVIRGVGKLIKPFVNFPSWMGWRQLSTTTKSITNTAKSIYHPDDAVKHHHETFAQAMQRLHLTENDLRQRMKALLMMTFFYCLIALGLFSYCIFLCLKGHLAAAFISLLLTVLALSLAFRQHFWYFQIKRRKLGCTIKEWFAGNFRGIKK